MAVFVANPTRHGGEVQLWPTQWFGVLDVLPQVINGGQITSKIREAMSAGTPMTMPIRITMTNSEIETIEIALRRITSPIGR